MFRAVLAWTLSLCLVVAPAQALTPAQSKDIRRTIQESEITSKPMTYPEIYKKIRPFLPYEMQREMDLYVKQNPNKKLPVASLASLRDQGTDAVRLEWIEGRDHLRLEIVGKMDFAILSGIHDGHKFERKIALYELRNPLRVIADLTGYQSRSLNLPSVSFLTEKEMRKLNPEEKRKYIDRVRSLLATAEKLQTDFEKYDSKSAKNEYEFLLNYLNQAAYAAGSGPSGACIVAGNVGSYQQGSCKPDNYIPGGCVQCNTDIYGANAPCVGGQGAPFPIDATAQCNDKTKDNPYAVYQGIPDDAGINDKRSRLQGVIRDLRAKCADISAGVPAGTKLPDQSDTCGELDSQLKRLESANCDLLASQPKNFPSLTCKKDQPAPAAQTETPTTPPTDKPRVQAPASQEKCDHLPSSDSDISCAGDEMKQLNCGTVDAPSYKYYCLCKDGEDASTYMGSELAVKCSAKVAPAPVVTEKTKDKDWKMPGWVSGLGVGLLGLGLAYFLMIKPQMDYQKQMQNYYNSLYYYPYGVGNTVYTPNGGVVSPLVPASTR